MTVIALPDVEGALRSWLRSQSEISAVVSTRVFFGVPDDTAFPLISLFRLGGTDQTGEAPLDDALIQFDCWGGIKNKAQAFQVANAVRGVLRAMTPQLLTPEVYGYGASPSAPFWSPDPEDDRARYVVTASVTARAA